MNEQIHYIKDSVKTGPVDRDQIKKLIFTREISGSTLVWMESLPDWMPLGEVELFRDDLAVKLPPPLAARQPASPVAPAPTPAAVVGGTPQNPASPDAGQPAANIRAPRPIYARIPWAIAKMVGAWIVLTIIIKGSNSAFDYEVMFEIGKGNMVTSLNALSQSFFGFLKVIPWAFTYFSTWPLHVAVGVLMAWQDIIILLDGLATMLDDGLNNQK